MNVSCNIIVSIVPKVRTSCAYCFLYTKFNDIIGDKRVWKMQEMWNRRYS